jgi:hypothetical protein
MDITSKNTCSFEQNSVQGYADGTLFKIEGVGDMVVVGL